MKKEKANLAEQIKTQKASFRQYQKNLSFTEKMETAFSLAIRDKTIRQAVLLPKNKKEGK